METHSFAGLDGWPRRAKPRAAGWTMVVDWGLGPRAQADLLEVGAPHFDFAKLAVGLSRLLPDELLKNKIASYRQAGVEPFPGGQYLEYAQIEGWEERYFAAVQAAGYGWVEVSDNLAPVQLSWKEEMIASAVGNWGLEVLGEVGKKEGLDNQVSLAENARACLGAGARIILLEAAELVGGDARVQREVEQVVQLVGVEGVMFELPGPWIEGVSASDIHRMASELVGRYGAEVNLGNVAPADMLPLEAYRRGLGVNAGKERPSGE